MSPDSYIGSISKFAGHYAPRGWMRCDGQTLPIMQYQALFSILGTTYGGNGTQNFMLPKLNEELPNQQTTPIWCICCEGMYPMRD